MLVAAASSASTAPDSAESSHVASTEPKPAQLIAASTNKKTAISTDTVLRQGCELFSRVLVGAGAFAFATGFCVGGGSILITEGALPGKTAAHFSVACLPFNGCGSVVGTAFLHSRNVISNRPRSPADQPSEECAAKTR